MTFLFVCDVCASYTVELKMVDAGNRFLWPFFAVLVICASVMVVFMVSFYFAALYTMSG